MIETYKITHGLYDTAVEPNLMTSQVSHTRGNMYKLQKNAFKYDIRKYFLLKVVNLWNSLQSLVVEAPSLNCFTQDKISFGLTKMFCIILKHHSWEPEAEVIHSLIVLFILLRTYIDVGIETTSLRPQC